MSPGHDVSEYELGVSGLPPMFHHNNRGRIDENQRKIMIFRKKTKLLCCKNWCLPSSGETRPLSWSGTVEREYQLITDRCLVGPLEVVYCNG